MIIEKLSNGNKYKIFDKYALIWRECKINRKDFTVKVKIPQLMSILNGNNIHDIMPEQSIYVRNFIETGFTPREQVYFSKDYINWNNINIDSITAKYFLLDIGLKSIIDASKYIMGVYNSSEKLKVKSKGEHQHLTKADIGSHNHILGYLRAHTPFFTLSEECGEKYQKMLPKKESFWLVDPLDGTQEFIKKNGEFGILISFIHKGKPIIGIMYFPVTDEIYFATAERGYPYKIKNFNSIITKHGFSTAISQRELLTINNPQNKDITLLTSRSYRTKEIDLYINKLIDNGYNVKEESFGAAVKFARILENKANVYARVCKDGRCPSQWDIAAAHCIIKAAGGEVLNFDTREELTYGHAEMKLPSFIIKHPKLKI